MRILKFTSYSFGNFANTIAYQIFGNPINFYYVDEFGLNAGIAGILWSIYGLGNAVNDPLMGQIFDKTRSKFGRRVPYVARGLPGQNSRAKWLSSMKSSMPCPTNCVMSFS